MQDQRKAEREARRVRAVLEYDGTTFHGFQRQSGLPTVQAKLEQELAAVCGHPVQVTGAGRTDTGVHALGQVVHFDTTGRIPTDRIATALYSRCGPELVLRQVEETTPEFHARFDAVRRTYQYYFCREAPSPFQAHYVTWDWGLRSDAGERMQAALPDLVGTHDFSAFRAARCTARRTVRTIYHASVEERDGLLRFEVSANAFLHSMVRIIAGLLLEIGRGNREPEAVRSELERGVRAGGAPTAPARGLFLTRVDYPDGYPKPERRGPMFFSVFD